MSGSKIRTRKLLQPILRRKTIGIYNYLKKEAQPDEETESSPAPSSSSFQASRGWFDKFKIRYNLRNVKLAREAASADVAAATEYPKEVQKLIEEKGYLPEQVFNADETGLFWKKMSNRTWISKKERTVSGFKAAKDRCTLLFCRNAAGDFKCNPMLVFRVENPRTLKGKTKSMLPVFWRSNKKAWVTAKVF